MEVTFFDVQHELVVYHKWMKEKKIIVWGLGRSGESAAEFCLKAGADVILVDQKLSTRVESLLQSKLRGARFCQQDLLQTDLVVDEIVLSPGIPRDLPKLTTFIQQKVSVINEVELAYRRWRRESRGPIVALTGSNGKTTTVHMIDELLKSHGVSSFLGGNVGTPFCEVFNQNIKASCAVLELSSFQLESLFEFKAEVRVILNLSYTHAERYPCLEDYARAKLRLAKNADSKDLFICGPFQDDILREERQNFSKDFIKREIPEAKVIKPLLEKKLNLKNFKPVGEHNLSNLWVAIKVCEFLGHAKAGPTQHFIETFQGPEHRLQALVKNKSIWVLNDSKSTNWASTLTALKSCKSAPSPLALILGGQKRGDNDSILPFIENLSSYVEQLYLIGESGQKHYDELVKHGLEGVRFAYFPDLESLIKEVSKTFSIGSLVFSPAFPSFDQYQNYEERGEHFKALVTKYLGLS